MSKQQCLWVVEEFWAGAWVPTSQIFDSRQGAAIECKDWAGVDYKDSYRVAKYVRVEPKKKRSKP